MKEAKKGQLVKRLLSDSSLPVCDIPERLGFASPNHLMRLFKARTGMTMLQWRRAGAGQRQGAL